jgi:hypothetical protein
VPGVVGHTATMVKPGKAVVGRGASPSPAEDDDDDADALYLTIRNTNNLEHNW